MLSIALRILVLGLLSLNVSPARAQTQTWLPTAGGTYNWDDSANWTPGPFANSSTAAAYLTNGISGNQTINLNEAITVNQLIVSAPYSYTLATGTSGSLTFAGTTPGLTVTAGAAAQTISAPITASAAFSISQNSAAGLTISGTVNNGGNLITTSGGGSTAFTNIISGSGGLTLTGAGTITLTGANTYTGATTINLGTLQIGTGGTSGVVAGNISDNAALTFNRSDSTTYSATLSGTGTVMKLGAGALTLTGTNTVSGITTVAAGTLQIGSGGTAGSLANSNVSINSAGTLAYNLSNTTTYSGVISGSGNLAQIGSGTLILNGTNTFTGTTTISAGTLQIGSGSTSGTIAGSIVNNATLIVNRLNAITLGNAISGTGTLVKQAAGTLTLTGTNSFTGATTISAGGIIYNSLSALGNGGAGSITVASGGFDAAGYAMDQNFLNQVNTASAGVIALGLASSNNLDLNTPGLSGVSLGATSSVTLSGTITPANSTYRFGGGNLNTNTLTVSSNLTGANALVVDSNGTTAGTVVLSGTNSYTGNTTVNAGTLRYAANTAMNIANASLTVNSGATVAAGYAIDQNFLNRVNSASNGVIALNVSTTNPLNLAAAGLTGVSLGATASVSTSGLITPAGSAYNLGGGGGSLTITSALTGSYNLNVGGNGTLTGTVILSNTANTYSGTTTVGAGILQFNSLGAIGGSGTSVTVIAGAVVAAGYAMDQTFLGRINTSSAGTVALAANSANNLDFNAPGLSGVSFGATTTAGFTYSGTLTPNGTTFSLGGGGGPLTVSSNLTGAGNTLLVRDSGNVILGGTNTFASISTDPNHPNTGIVVTNVNGLGSGSISFAARNLSSTAAIPVLGFDLGASASTTFANSIALDSSTFAKDFSIQSNNSQTITLSGVISGGNAASSVQFTNAIASGQTGTFVLASGSNSFSGTVEVVQGTLAVSSDAVLGNSANAIKLSLNSGTLGGFQFSNGFATARNVIVNKDSRIIQADTVNPATISGVVSGSGVTLYVTGGGTLFLSNAANTFGGNFEIDGGSTVILAGANNNVASMIVSAGTSLQIGSGATGTLGAANLLDSGTLAFNRSNTYAFAGIINGTGSITQQGAGDLTLSGNNTASGTLTVAAGTLTLTGTNSTISGTTVATGTTLTIGGGITGTGTLAGNITNSGTVAFNRSNAYSFGGIISGGGGVTIIGTGTITFTAAHTYTGTTAVNAGTLVIDGSTAAGSAVNVASGATLAGTGSIGGTSTLNSGATLAPGDASIGTLSTTNAVTINGGSGSTWLIGINGLTSTKASTLALSGAGSNLNLVLSSTNKLILSVQALNSPAFVGGTPYTYTIATADSSANFLVNGSAFAFTPSDYTLAANLAIQSYSLSESGNQLQLTFTPSVVPEPGTLLLGCIGLAGMARLFRRLRTGHRAV